MRTCKIFLLCAVTLLVAVLLTGAEHKGQVKFGGLPLPGASVTASQGEKKLGAITDPQGDYSFTDLSDGSWTLRIEMLCFESMQQEVTVKAEAPPSQWEMKMLPFDTIKASAPPPPPVESAPAVSTTLASPAAPTSAAQKKNSRQAKNAATAAPANTPSAFQRTDVNASAAPVPAAAAENSAASAAPGEANQAPSEGFLINGSVNNGAASPFGQSGAFGNNRRGARSLYNMSLGFVVRDSLLDARPFSVTGQDTPKPSTSHVTGLASFGGPLKIPHLVPRNGPNIQISYQWVRNRDGSAPATRMPTVDERLGDFSKSLNPLGQPVSIIDPSNGAPFTGAAIPQDRISSQALSLLRFYPLPNFNASSAYNYQIPLVSSMHQDNLQARSNKALGRKNGLNGSFGLQSTRSDNPSVFGFLDTGGNLGINAQISWRHTFTQRMFLTVGYTFSRFSSHNTPYFANRENVSGQAGITGNNQDPVNWGPPALSFTGGIHTLSASQYSSNHNQTGALSSSLFWAHGSHNFTFGGDFRRQQFNQFSQSNARGQFTFTGAAAGNDFAGFLLGIPDASALAFGNADKYLRDSSYDAYVNDDWRLSPSLTLNPGIRWEYSAPITELYGRLVNLDIAPGFGAIAPVVAASATGPVTGQRYPGSLINPHKRAIQPRIGLSWRPFLASSMVVRAGYGVYYDTSIYLAIANPMTQQSPLSKSLSVQNTAANPLTLANGFNAPPNVVTNTFAVDPYFRPGYSQNWQVSVQRDLPASLVMIATYLGIKGTHAQQQFLPNTFPAGAVNPCPSCQAGYKYLTSNGNSTRQSGMIQLRRRLHNGFTAQVQYTYSKSIDNASLGGAGSVIAQDWLNLSGERGPSNFDQRHLANVQLQYTTGMGLAGGTLVGGWKGALLKDWTIASQINAGSGLPLTPIYSALVAGTGVSGSIRPDYTGASLYDAPPGLFLNPAALARPASGHWGNAGRNSITGPSQLTLNASMARTFRFSDRVSADLRIDANNALNHVTFPNWNVNITSAQFGLPMTANQMRTVQTRFLVRF